MATLAPNAPGPTTTPPEDAAPLDATSRTRQDGAGLKLRVQRPGEGIVVLHAEGELDSAGAARLAEPLRQRLTCTAGTVVLDLSAVSFLNSHAATVLLDGAARAHSNGKRLRIISSLAADRLLRLIGVDDRFTYTRGLDDVLRGEPAGEGNAVTGRA